MPGFMPGIHALAAKQEGVDGRDKPGHDETDGSRMPLRLIFMGTPDVAVPLRVVTMDLAKDDEPKAPLVFINPEVVSKSDDKATYEEGCLSIPEYYEEVERPASVKVRYMDLDGKPQEIEATGLLATCLQHEIDHTNGVLFIDYISKLKRDMVMKKFKKAAKRGEPVKPLAGDKTPSHHIG
jgi:peptide deformylase